MAVEAFAQWRRLDLPGRDACWLERDGDRWTLYGAALFAHERGPVFVDYNISYDRNWHTEAAHLRGRIGSALFEHHIKRDGPEWIVDNQLPVTMGEATQIDFGFTPATNYAQLKRLAPGGADIVVAWFDIGEKSLTALPQIYLPASGNKIDYQSPLHKYAASLTIATNGFIADYPGLWVMESEREPI